MVEKVRGTYGKWSSLLVPHIFFLFAFNSVKALADQLCGNI